MRAALEDLRQAFEVKGAEDPAGASKTDLCVALVDFFGQQRFAEEPDERPAVVEALRLDTAKFTQLIEKGPEGDKSEAPESTSTAPPCTTWKTRRPRKASTLPFGSNTT